MSSLRVKRQWKVISETYFKSQKNRKKISEFIEKLKKWDTVNQKVWTDIAFFCNYADSTHHIYKTVKELWDCLKRIKKLIKSIYYLTQIRALINYKQNFKKTAEQMLNTLRIIQSEVAVYSFKISIYDNIIWEILLRALREKLYSLMIFQIWNKLIESSLNNVIQQLKKKEIEQALNNSAKNVTVNSVYAD